jgi:flagellar FliL protein
MYFMGGGDHSKDKVVSKEESKGSKKKHKEDVKKAEAADEEAEEEEIEEEEEAEEEEEHKQAFYSSLAPAFVVNFQSKDSKTRFLKLELDVVTRQEEQLESIKTHMPKIRNNLVLLFSRQVYEDLISHEGKERLRAEALDEIQKVLKKETGKKAVEDVFFTSFVMQ